MKFLLFISALLCASLVSFGQDSIVAPSGTQVLPASYSNAVTGWQIGAFLDTLILDPCEAVNRPDPKKHGLLNHVITTDTTWEVSFRIVETCCLDFLCEVEMIDSSTINFVYRSYGTKCACTCCYSLNYVFVRPGYVTANDHKRLDLVTHYVVNGDLEKKQLLKQ